MSTICMSTASSPPIINYLLHLCKCTEHPYTAVRHMGARCLGVFSKVSTLKTMTVILDELLPSLGAMENDKKRQGTIEVVAHVIELLGLDLVPFIVLLVVPVLGRMSDPNQAVRLTATHCFASLVRLMPLENGLRDSPALPLHLIEKKQKEKQFLEQLVDIKKLENYHVPVPIEAELRCYQQEGVNWLFFLNSYKLHGILCDDMGLGKTLQSICILAGDHFNRDQEYKVCIWLLSLPYFVDLVPHRLKQTAAGRG
uniref:SNF2 N-terminal domain-containing protein n=1 Tax=Strigamia maritima TaxID=126957 RepID=T1JHC4_STRMM